jgi:uncharacterized protein (DUF924 family)
MNYQTIAVFWFDETKPQQWFSTDPEFDRLIKARFQAIHDAAGRGELYPWREAAEGRLAEIIVLDQFSRNMYRDTPLAFASDPLALVLAQEALRANAHLGLSAARKAFLYMPFMHSESPLIHQHAVALFSEPGLESNLEFELKHKATIDRFGRYPHRNAILGRPSTREEREFLKSPGTSF